MILPALVLLSQWTWSHCPQHIWPPLSMCTTFLTTSAVFSRQGLNSKQWMQEGICCLAQFPSQHPHLQVVIPWLFPIGLMLLPFRIAWHNSDLLYAVQFHYATSQVSQVHRLVPLARTLPPLEPLRTPWHLLYSNSHSWPGCQPPLYIPPWQGWGRTSRSVTEMPDKGRNRNLLKGDSAYLKELHEWHLTWTPENTTWILGQVVLLWKKNLSTLCLFVPYMIQHTFAMSIVAQAFCLAFPMNTVVIPRWFWIQLGSIRGGNWDSSVVYSTCSHRCTPSAALINTSC